MLTQAGCSAWPLKKYQSHEKLREDILTIGDRLMKKARKSEQEHDRRKERQMRRSITAFEMVDFIELNSHFIDDLQLLVEAVWGD